ncbi:MAG: UbiX family flavin prenyltransferase [Orrella sp.]
MSTKRRLVVGVTGATGSVYAVRLLELARQQADVEVHLVVSASGLLNIKHELGLSRTQVQELADHVYSVRDIGATLASGSFSTTGMIVVPCSMRTLAAVAHGLSDNLITRAADVTLKERRRLVMAIRETPFNLAHLRNMTAVTEMGGIIFPPLPAFYHLPQTIGEIIDHSVVRMLELVGIDVPRPSWPGLQSGVSEAGSIDT